EPEPPPSPGIAPAADTSDVGASAQCAVRCALPTSLTVSRGKFVDVVSHSAIDSGGGGPVYSSIVPLSETAERPYADAGAFDTVTRLPRGFAPSSVDPRPGTGASGNASARIVNDRVTIGGRCAAGAAPALHPVSPTTTTVASANVRRPRLTAALPSS